MTDASAVVIRRLQELIDALDRRVPRHERPAEAEIAQCARVLRARATRHIDTMVDAESDHTDGRLSDVT